MAVSTPYRRGYRFELRVRDHLEARGWVVFRSAGSHSPVDLLALKAGEVWLVQCQATLDLHEKDRESLGALAHSLDCCMAVAYRWGKALKFEGISDSGVAFTCYFPGKPEEDEEERREPDEAQAN